ANEPGLIYDPAHTFILENEGHYLLSLFFLVNEELHALTRKMDELAEGGSVAASSPLSSAAAPVRSKMAAAVFGVLHKFGSGLTGTSYLPWLVGDVLFRLAGASSSPRAPPLVSQFVISSSPLEAVQRGSRRPKTNFRGEYTLRLDNKRRFILPKKFREQIKRARVVTLISFGLSNIPISVYPASIANSFFRGIYKRATTRAQISLIREISGNSFDAKIGRDGRITIPRELRERFEGAREVEVRGRGEYFTLLPLGRVSQAVSSPLEKGGEFSESVVERARKFGYVKEAHIVLRRLLSGDSLRENAELFRDREELNLDGQLFYKDLRLYGGGFGRLKSIKEIWGKVIAALMDKSRQELSKPQPNLVAIAQAYDLFGWHPEFRNLVDKEIINRYLQAFRKELTKTQFLKPLINTFIAIRQGKIERRQSYARMMKEEGQRFILLLLHLSLRPGDTRALDMILSQIYGLREGDEAGEFHPKHFRDQYIELFYRFWMALPQGGLEVMSYRVLLGRLQQLLEKDAKGELSSKEIALMRAIVVIYTRRALAQYKPFENLLLKGGSQYLKQPYPYPEEIAAAAEYFERVVNDKSMRLIPPGEISPHHILRVKANARQAASKLAEKRGPVPSHVRRASSSPFSSSPIEGKHTKQWAHHQLNDDFTRRANTDLYTGALQMFVLAHITGSGSLGEIMRRIVEWEEEIYRHGKLEVLQFFPDLRNHAERFRQIRRHRKIWNAMLISLNTKVNEELMKLGQGQYPDFVGLARVYDFGWDETLNEKIEREVIYSLMDEFRERLSRREILLSRIEDEKQRKNKRGANDYIRELQEDWEWIRAFLHFALRNQDVLDAALSQVYRFNGVNGSAGEIPFSPAHIRFGEAERFDKVWRELKYYERKEILGRRSLLGRLALLLNKPAKTITPDESALMRAIVTVFVRRAMALGEPKVGLSLELYLLRGDGEYLKSGYPYPEHLLAALEFFKNLFIRASEDSRLGREWKHIRG
ncbi:hypothetical protein EPN16_06325, partial [bacterium]